ncbi:MAG: hypothetical protein IT190_10645, partial [Microbacteriaceae bacterium]|nr:hypothetical protein [Microbacteriaceae bacterium]
MESINESFQNTKIESTYKKMNGYIKIISTMFQENFYQNNECKQAYKRLELLKSKQKLTRNESFYFGFYIGAFTVCGLLVITLLIETKFFDPEGSDFVRYMFRVLRGTLMLFVYWFLFGVDVYVWERYNINYKRVFDIEKDVTSSSFQIMERSFAFLAMWMIAFSYCAISNTEFFQSALIFNKVTSMYVAPSVWLIFFLYIFFPSTTTFDYHGRMRLLKGIWNVVIGPFGRITALQSWSMAQLLSFLIVLKDFMYTVCYSKNVYEHQTIQNQCEDNLRFIEFMTIFVICTWKNIFGVNKFIYLHKDRHKMTEAD